MRILVGLLLVVAVSGGEKVTGDEEMTLDGILNDSVLLQCPCPNRDEKEDFRWQKETLNTVLVYSSTSDFNEEYMGRAKIFVGQNKFNCSLLLTNITVDDQGKYRCSFTNETYNRSFVNLTVYANYSVCQKNPATNMNDKLSAKVFHCDVQGHYRDTEIHWYLDNQLLTNSSTTLIMHTHALDVSTGIYSFNSKLIMELRGTSEPRCNITSKGISAISSCVIGPGKIIGQQGQQSKCFKTYVNVIPVVLVLGFSLILWCRWKSTQGITEDENDYSSC